MFGPPEKSVDALLSPLSHNNTVFFRFLVGTGMISIVLVYEQCIFSLRISPMMHYYWKYEQCYWYIRLPHAE